MYIDHKAKQKGPLLALTSAALLMTPETVRLLYYILDVCVYGDLESRERPLFTGWKAIERVRRGAAAAVHRKKFYTHIYAQEISTELTMSDGIAGFL